MFKKWDPDEIFFFLILPACVLALVIFGSPQACRVEENQRRERLFKECIERHDPEQCRFMIEERSK